MALSVMTKENEDNTYLYSSKSRQLLVHTSKWGFIPLIFEFSYCFPKSGISITSEFLKTFTCYHVYVGMYKYRKEGNGVWCDTNL